MFFNPVGPPKREAERVRAESLASDKVAPESGLGAGAGGAGPGACMGGTAGCPGAACTLPAAGRGGGAAGTGDPCPGHVNRPGLEVHLVEGNFTGVNVGAWVPG